MGTNIIEQLHKDMMEFTMKEKKEHSCLKLGDMAPEFTAETTFGECKLSDYRGKWLVFFSHPRRFYSSLHY